MPERIIYSKRVFSEKLIQKCKDVFEKRAGRPITDDEADLYLSRLADLGLIIGKIASESHNNEK